MTRGWASAILVLAIGAFGIAALAIVLISTNDTVVVELDAGDCFELPDDIDDRIGTVDTTDCDDPHEAEVVATGELDPGRDLDYPPGDESVTMADRRCTAEVDDPAIVTDFGILPVVADEGAWEPLAGRYVCVAIPYGGGTTTGSLLDDT
jgi:hypothetical protein